MENDIERIDKEINDFSTGIDIDEYLDRLPEILSKTVELARNAGSREETEEIRADIQKLLEITTVELTVSNKKELKIKLFDVLDSILSGDLDMLEVCTPTDIRTFVENYDRIQEKYGTAF